MVVRYLKPNFKRIPPLKSEENKSKLIKVLPQTGKVPDLLRDKSRLARLPGKRTSKTGKTYWETRKNRSDKSVSARL